MPTPIVHSSLGYAMASIKKRPSLKKTAVFLFCAQMHDLDFIPGALIGDIGKYHHTYTHSFMGAFLLGLCVWFFWKKNFFILIFLSLMHPLFDLFCADNLGLHKHHKGMPLFWPFSMKEYFSIEGFFSAPLLILPLEKIFISENLLVIYQEVFISLLFFLCFFGGRKIFAKKKR